MELLILKSGRSLLPVAVGLLILLVSVNSADEKKLKLKLAEPCSPVKCQLPDCRCSDLALPRPDFEGREREIPQFVTVTFDDAVNWVNFDQYQKLFDGLVNPDQCTASATFFISHEYTDYTKVNKLYNEGHEIALHSMTHGTGTDYWREADEDMIEREFGYEVDMMVKYAKVSREDIRGMRLPFLQISGNKTFSVGKRLGLLYDSSWPTQSYRDSGMWPYTLDYQSTQDCPIGTCPDASIPGFWVYPMVMWVDKKGYSCAMIDGCIYSPDENEDEIFEFMLENFHRHYEGNRSPFPMFLHAAWFGRGRQHFSAFKRLLTHLTSLPDVYITTPSRVIDYLRNPVLGKPFQECVKKPETTCKPKSCELRKMFSEETRYITVCDRCPEIYPWLDNPLGSF